MTPSTRVISQKADEAFAFWDYGPELSRRFRALKVWMALKAVGVRGFAAAIEKDLACARYFEALVRASTDFEMLAPVELSIFCFRHVPAALRGAGDEQIDAWNERLLVELQRDGSSYLSNARIGGRFSLRGCVMNYRTTPQDMEILLADLRRVASAAAPITLPGGEVFRSHHQSLHAHTSRKTVDNLRHVGQRDASIKK